LFLDGFQENTGWAGFGARSRSQGFTGGMFSMVLGVGRKVEAAYRGLSGLKTCASHFFDTRGLLEMRDGLNYPSTNVGITPLGRASHERWAQAAKPAF